MPSGPPICALRASGRPTSGSDYGGGPSPAARDWKSGMANKKEKHLHSMFQLNDMVLMAGWGTPMSNTPLSTHCYGKDRKIQLKLAGQALLAGWLTPKTPTGGGQAVRQKPGGGLRKLEDQVVGLVSTSSPAPTERRGALNPAHSRWLMGFPPAWDDCAPMATRSSRKSRRSS